MDNAPRALLIAGGIMIALMVVAIVLTLIFTIRDYYRGQYDSTKASQIAEINNQFEPYIKDELTLMEMKTLYNKIQSYNTKNPDEIIHTNIKQIYEDGKTYRIDTLFSEIDQDEKVQRKFAFDGNAEYYSNGKIKKMNFREKTE